MNSRIMEQLELLEDKIENLKWLATMPFPVNKREISNTINIIRKSSGIIGKTSLKGIVYENRARKQWKTRLT